MQDERLCLGRPPLCTEAIECLLTKAPELRAQLHGNCCEARLELQQWLEAVSDAKTAIEIVKPSGVLHNDLSFTQKCGRRLERAAAAALKASAKLEAPQQRKVAQRAESTGRSVQEQDELERTCCVCCMVVSRKKQIQALQQVRKRKCMDWSEHRKVCTSKK